MDQTTQHYLIPTQLKGIKKDLFYSVAANTVEDAEDWFVEAKNRLLDVNNWQQYSTDFRAHHNVLTDSHGKEVNRHARQNDYIRSEIQKPGNGSQFNLTHIESIEYDDYPDEDIETIAIKMRSANSMNGQPLSTYPHNNETTVTFIIERRGKRLTSNYHLRNELPDIEGETIDNINRNLWYGTSDDQWKALLSGFIGQ